LKLVSVKDLFLGFLVGLYNDVLTTNVLRTLGVEFIFWRLTGLIVLFICFGELIMPEILFLRLSNKSLAFDSEVSNWFKAISLSTF